MTDKTSRPGAPVPGKRPYATIDLKATEIKVTKINSGAGAASAIPTDVPLPLPPRAYGVDLSASGTTRVHTQSTSMRQAVSQPMSSDAEPQQVSGTTSRTIRGASSVNTDTPTPPPSATQKDPAMTSPPAPRGGFASHLVASIVGGALALAGGTWLMPQLTAKMPWLVAPTTATSDSVSPALDARLQDIEQRIAVAAQGGATLPTTNTELDGRLAALEEAVREIPALTAAQSKLAADTKAAFAASASDAGVPEQLSRIAAIEDKFRALEAAGANDPSSGRIEQLVAVTGKVADLESTLATQLSELRSSVTTDVETRLASIKEITETARSGVQRIDRDLAAVKTDAAKINERLASLDGEVVQSTATSKQTEAELGALKTELQALSTSVAKPDDISASLAPLDSRIAELDKTVQRFVAAEAERTANANRVVLALELQNLRRALDSGQSYANELEKVQAAAGGQFDLAALEKTKSEGVPTVATLNESFRNTAHDAMDTEIAAEGSGVLDRLLSGAKSIVRVRKTDHAADDTSTEAVLGRMETALKEKRLGDVLDQAKTLPPKAQGVMQPLLDKIAARAAVDETLAQLEQQLKSSMSGTATPPPETSQ